jgi:hypothetical protein
MPYKNIYATLTDAQQISVLKAIKDIEATLRCLINLTAQERQALPKMGNATQSFVTKALEIATNNPQFVPPYADLAAMRKDYDLAMRL